MEDDKKNKTRDYNRQYYLQHRDQMLNYGNRKIECQHCKKIVSRNNLKKHQNTKKCLNTRDKFKIE